MRELNLLVVSSVDFVPDKPIDVFAGNLYFMVNASHRELAIACLLFAVIDDLGQLLKLFPPKQLNVHQVDQGTAVLQLFARLIEL